MIDMTPVGHLSATGQIKKAFLGNWPEDAFMQIWNTDTRNHDLRVIKAGQSIESSQSLKLSVQQAAEKGIEFLPDVVYFRPVDMEVLFDVTEKVLSITKKPLVIHIMDDWPERLKINDLAKYNRLNGRLIKLIQHADLLLSISQAMSNVYKQRYGGEWFPLANGVELADFPSKDWSTRPPITQDNPFLIRYNGGLAEDMSFYSVKDIAKAVASLQNKFPVKLEIRTMQWYLKKAQQELAIYPGVYIDQLVDSNAYIPYLCEADALVIAYNFDDKSIAYTGLSLANKMPECLASGAVVFAYGPGEVTTVDYLRKTGCAMVVTQNGHHIIYDSLKKLIENTIICSI